MIGMTPRRGDKVWVLHEQKVDEIKVSSEKRGTFMGYERGKPIICFPDGTRTLLLSSEYMRVA